MIDAIISVTGLAAAVTGLLAAMVGYVAGRRTSPKPKLPSMFVYGDGSFLKEGGRWREHDRHGNQRFLFDELRVEDGFVIVFDASRGLLVRLPLGGGTAECSQVDQHEWHSLYRVEPGFRERLN